MKTLVTTLCLIFVSGSAFAEQAKPVVCTAKTGLYWSGGREKVSESKVLLSTFKDGAAEIKGSFTDGPNDVKTSLDYSVYTNENVATITLRLGPGNEGAYSTSGTLTDKKEVSAKLSGPLMNQQAAKTYEVSCKLAY
jgi:hypothetical protein